MSKLVKTKASAEDGSIQIRESNIQNPNLQNVIKKLEGKAGALITEVSEEEAVLVEETRTRKYKRALDTLGAR